MSATALHFSDIRPGLRDGKRYRRAAWGEAGAFIALVPESVMIVHLGRASIIAGEGTEIRNAERIDITNGTGSTYPWTPTVADVMADDWAEAAPVE